LTDRWQHTRHRKTTPAARRASRESGGTAPSGILRVLSQFSADDLDWHAVLVVAQEQRRLIRSAPSVDLLDEGGILTAPW
jgi:hypothetical protein